MAESPPPPPLTSQSHDIDEPPILKLGLDEADPFIHDDAPCDPIGKDHGSSSQNASIHGVEELELGESIERELLELAIAQAVIEAEGKNVKDENSVGVENKEVANSAEEDARTGTEEEVADEKSGKNGENGEEGIGDEGEVMKFGGQGQHRDHNMQRRAIFPMRPNAEDCAYYMKFGSCKFGHSCKFNHPPRRKNQVKEKPKHKEENSERGGQAECKYYLMSGGCRYGKDCKYSHGPDKISSPNNPEFNFLGLPIRPGEKECPYYMRNGSCKYGSNCRFHHPEPKTVAGGGSPSGYGNGGSLPTQLISAPVGFTDTPFIPVMFPPTQGGATPNTEWNGYPAVPYPTSEKGLPTPPAFAMNNLPAELSFPMQHQQRVTVLEEYPERPGEPECNFFLKTGDCKFKSNCKFHHPKNRSSHAKVNSFSLNDKGLPLRPDQPICTHYHRYGICKYGPGCKYDHSPKLAISSSPDVPSGNSKIVDGAETSEQGNEGESC